MHTARFAIVPLLGLALTGATPPAPSAQALIECRVPREQAPADLSTFTVIKRTDTNREFAVPAGTTAFGLPVTAFNALERQTDGLRRLTIMAVIASPYERTLAAALKAHGVSQCLHSADDGAPGCLVTMDEKDGWAMGLAVLKFGDRTGIACGYVQKGN